MAPLSVEKEPIAPPLRVQERRHRGIRIAWAVGTALLLPIGLAVYQVLAQAQPVPTEVIIFEAPRNAQSELTSADDRQMMCAQRALNSPRESARYCVQAIGSLGFAHDPCFLLEQATTTVCPFVNKDGELTQEVFGGVQFPPFDVDQQPKPRILPNDMLATDSRPWAIYIDTKGPTGKIGCSLVQPGANAPFDAARGTYVCPGMMPIVNVPGAIDGSNGTSFSYQGPEASRALDIDKSQPRWTIKFFDKTKSQYAPVPVIKAWF